MGSNPIITTKSIRVQIMELFTNKVFLALLFIVAVGLFLIMREVYCWYFKLNKIVDLLEKNQQIEKETNRLLQQLNDKL